MKEISSIDTKITCNEIEWKVLKNRLKFFTSSKLFAYGRVEHF